MLLHGIKILEIKKHTDERGFFANSSELIDYEGSCENLRMADGQIITLGFHTR
jgi:dTDP-4-dehydrorhamnose 3,5-epimerase-like enzyme